MTNPLTPPPMAPACVVTTLGTDRPQSFMLATSRGVTLMEQPPGATLNLYADDQIADRDAQWLALVGELQRDAAEREREACAKVCDEQHDRARTSTGAARADACAAAIRARGEKGGA